MPPHSTAEVPPPEHEPASSAGADAHGRDGQLPRDLAAFLVELSVAMHKYGIYPPGHPLLAQAVEELYASLTPLLLERHSLSIGVARRQLIIEGVATDPAHPLLAELAGKLHRHQLGAMKLIRGLSADDLAEMLATVGLEPKRDEEPLGTRPELLQSRWVNAKLFPLTYDRLELLDEEPGQGGGARGGHAARLWVGLARAAIAAERGAEAAEPAMDPETVAHAIDEHGREEAYDQAIVGYFLQIAREVRTDASAETSGLQRRISTLVGSLQPATLERLLEMGGDVSQRRRFVLDAAQGMTVDAVVELVQAAANAEGQTISHSLMRMLTKLATHASADDGARSRAADGALREHVGRLVGSWSLNDPNPLAYSAALEQLVQHDAAPGPESNASSFACEPSRVIAMALELGMTGGRVSHAATAMLDADELSELLDLLGAAPTSAGEVTTNIWSLIAARDPLRAALAEPRLDHALVRRLVVRCGASAAAPLLAALDECEESSRRERLVSYLVLLGADVAPDVAEHLGRASAPLARELLACLARLAPPSAPVEAGPYLGHIDPTVRREAVKLLLAYGDTREEALLAALRDEDERVVYSGLVAAQNECSPAAAAIIRERLELGELNDGAVRAAGVRAAANVRDDETLEWVLRRTLIPGGLLRKTRLAPASHEMLASLTALATHWRGDQRAEGALSLARASSSPSVRGAVRREESAAAPETS